MDMEKDNSWKNDVPFKAYNLGGTVLTEKLGLTIVVNSIKSDLSESNAKVMQLFVERNQLYKLFGKEIDVKNIYASSGTATLKDFVFNLNLNMWDYQMKIKGKNVDFSELLSELRYKDATVELNDLFQTKTKTDDFFEYGKRGIIQYYCKSEEKFFEFQNLFVNKQFSLPDDPAERENLIKAINSYEDGSGDHVNKVIPSVSERVAAQTFKFKVTVKPV